MKIQPIVEGQSEVQSVPVLLRRLLSEAGAYAIEIGSPIRRHASVLNQKVEFQKSVRLALQQEECGAVLILFDYEDGCPKTKAAELAEWVQDVNPTVPCHIVLAYREFETWFLASLESLRDCANIDLSAQSPSNPEVFRDAKGALEQWMPRNRSYAETVDQPRLTAVFDMAAAHRRNRSFRRLVSVFGTQVRALGATLEEWPPTAWQPEQHG